VLNILSSLPPKSLFRFRCVCKTWRTLVGNPDFFTPNSINRSILPDPNCAASLLLVEARSGFHNFNYENIFYFLSGETLERHPLELSKSETCGDIKIVASCNGLICLHQHNGQKIYLWNPATSEAIMEPLPRLPPSQYEKGMMRMKFCAILITVGFGFDRRSNDFKVLRISNIVRNNRCCMWYDISTEIGKKTTNRQVEVYSLSTRRWRLIDVSVPFDELCIRRQVDGLLNFPTTASDGFFFWWVVPTEHHGKHYDNEEIVAFDFGEEIFRTTPLPRGAHFSHYSSLNLSVLNGSVAIMGFSHFRSTKRKRMQREESSEYFVIWVLFEFGVKESWTKLVSIPVLLYYPERPLGFRRNQVLILEKEKGNKKGQLVLYDLLTHTKHDVLQIHGNERLLQVFPFDKL
jgi:F-box interacting protein